MHSKGNRKRGYSVRRRLVLLVGLAVTIVAAVGVLVLGERLLNRSRQASDPVSPSPATISRETVARVDSDAKPTASVPSIDSETLQRYRDKPLDTWLLDKICVQPRETHKQSIANAAALLTNSIVSLGKREPVRIPSSPEWNEDPYNDATWRSEYQSLAFVLSLLVAYRESGDTAYLLLSKRYIGEWLDVMLPKKTLSFSWDELSQDDLDACVQLCTARGASGDLLEIDNEIRKRVNWLYVSDMIKKSKRGYMWSDTVAAGRVYVFSVFWPLWCATDLSDRDFEEMLLLALRPHVIRMLDSRWYAWDHNHGFISDTCLLIASIVFSEDKASKMWRQVALSRLSNQIAEGVSSEGVYGEHSPSYHAGMCFRYADIATYTEHYGFKSDIDVSKIIKEMSLFIAHCALPNAKAPLLGDSSRFAGRSTTPGFSEECVYSLTRGRQGSKPNSTSLVLKNAGYAFLRDRWGNEEDFEDTVYVGFIASVFSRSHKHCDDLSVILYGYGEEWLIDSGPYSYNYEDPLRQYSISPAAHNLVQVDGIDYMENYPNERTREAPLELIQSHERTDTNETIVAEHTFFPGVRYRRVLRYERPNRLWVRDELFSDAPHDYILRWHIAPGKHVQQLAEHGSCRVNSTRTGSHLNIKVTGSEAFGQSLVRGAMSPEVQGWSFPRFFSKEASPVLQFDSRGSNIWFETELELVRE